MKLYYYPINGVTHLIYKENDIYYVLVLQINENINQFFYSDALWTNKEPLNQDHLILGYKNAKYPAYWQIPINSYKILINGEFFDGEPIDEQKGKTLLEWEEQPIVHYNTRKQWFKNLSYQYAKDYRTNFKFFGGAVSTSLGSYEPYGVTPFMLGSMAGADGTGKFRMGFMYDDNGLANADSCVGAGMYHRYSSNNNSSGYIAWETNRQFLSMALFVELPIKFFNRTLVEDFPSELIYTYTSFWDSL